jgi:hypothetical protein
LTGKNKPDGIALRYRKEVPTNTPGFVRREYDGLDLFIADAIPEGWLAFYKGNCGSLGDVCDYRAIFYNDDRTQRWDLNLNRYLQQERYVEIQDVRYHDGQLFFNEACATYASEVQGQCSWLVSVDPTFQEENWRTPPMTSNNVFILHDRSIRPRARSSARRIWQVRRARKRSRWTWPVVRIWCSSSRRSRSRSRVVMWG